MQHFTQMWFGLIVDISIKSLLLAGAVGLVILLFRVRDTNLRHRIWTAVLLGMLAMPLLVNVTPAVPLPRWVTLAMPSQSYDPHSNADQSNIVLADAKTQHSDRAIGNSYRIMNSNSMTSGDTNPSGLSLDMQAKLNPAMAASSHTTPSAILDAAKHPSLASQIAGWLPLVFAVLYFSVASMFAARVLIGLLLTQRLVRFSREIQMGIPTASSQRNTVRLLESQLRVPVTVGIIRPAILLPAAWRKWNAAKLQAVLAHEMAHVRRADWLVVILAELNRALYWFHPVAWILKRRLSELAEQNCDDAVIEGAGDRTQYARYLLEVASSLTGAGPRYRASLQGVAMARTTNVESRIEAILDVGRPLARKIGALGIAGLIALVIPIVLFAAAMRTAADDPQRTSAGTEVKAAKGADQSSEQTKASHKQQHVKGRVLAPNGKPMAGATVIACWDLTRRDPPSNEVEYKIVAQTQTDAEGSYELIFSTPHPDPTRLTSGWQTVAFAPGYGPAWKRDVKVVKDVAGNSATTLTLSNDQSIRGRIVDLEGNPLAGVQVRIHALHSAESEDAFADWMQEAKEKSPPSNVNDYFNDSMSSMSRRGSQYPRAFPAAWDDGLLAHGCTALPADVSTDSDGRFEFYQLGANRLAILEVESPSIAKCYVQAVTREMKPVLAKPFESMGNRTGTYYGQEFQFVAEPTQPIEGTVTDVETGKPLANSEVYLEQFAGNLFSQRDFLTTRTDKQGHYRLIGAPRGGGHRIAVTFSSDLPYFPTEKRIAKVSGFDPITCDFALPRGLWITGKVTDRISAAPIDEAIVDYLPLRSNEHAQDYPNYNPAIAGHAPSYRYQTKPDGSFRVLAIPGAGILAAISQRDDKHIYFSLNEESVPKHLVDAKGNLVTYHPWTLTGYNALCEVDLAKSDQNASYNLQFDRGLTRKINLTDAAGKPVKKVRVLGRYFPPRLEETISESAVEIVGLRPKDERDVVFINPELRVGKAVTVVPGEEMTVELEPCAIARGRVVDGDKQPMRNVEIKVTINNRDNWLRDLIGTTAGDDGRFEVLLPPGATCRIWHYKQNGLQFSAECQAKPGVVFELGDLSNGTKLGTEQTANMLAQAEPPDQSGGESAAALKQPKYSEAADSHHSKIHGRITDADGKPAAGADVAVIGLRATAERGGDLTPPVAILAEAKTDANGNYQLQLTGISSKTHREANIIARSGTSALSWQRLNLDAAEVEASLQLPAEQTISGRLVDLEGQPTAGVQFHVASIAPNSSVLHPPAEGIGLFNMTHPPAVWPPAIVTDDNGAFTIHGIPKDNGVHLEMEGNERFAPQSLALNTGIPEQRGERDGTYRPQVVKNLKPGEEAVLPLAPAQIFTGTVRFEDTGEPAPNARLTIWASQQKYGSMISVAGEADDQGRYKISPNPGIRFGITAYPPDGTAYLARQLEPIAWQSGDQSKEVDVKFQRGVLVRGQVLEEGTNSPVVGASVQYAPESANNPNKIDGVLTGWQDIHVTDERGGFQIVVFPGRGHLLAHGPQNDFVFQEVSDREISSGEPGGRRNYTHGIERIDPALGKEADIVTIRLKRGATVRGVVVDEQGAPIKEALQLSRLQISPLSMFWRGFPVPVMDGRFEVTGLAPDQEYPVYFLETNRRLGATLMVKSGMNSPQVALQPCGQIKMRFVDDQGKPVGKFEPTIQIVVTPGGLTMGMASMSAGQPAADADFIRNIDRVNHPLPEQSDADGQLTVPALIPGATYRIVTFRNKKFELAKEFIAKGGETVDLGDIAVERRE